MAADRPSIDADVLRRVRQRCAYGCVVCGLPVYQYDHLLGWSETERHVESEITLLCGNHHDEKTRGRLPASVVERANANPHNVGLGVTTPYGLHFGGAEPAEMIIGGNRFTSTGVDMFPIVVDDTPLVAFTRSEGELRLHLNLWDCYNQPRLMIKDNVLIGRTDSWDMSYVGQVLTLRDGPGNISLRIRLEAPNRVTIDRARLMYNGVLVEVHSERVTVGRDVATFVRGKYSEVPVGILVGYCPIYGQGPLPFRFNVNRYPTHHEDDTGE